MGLGNGKDSFYFLHDSGARNDPRIFCLMTKHGLAGYGAFFVLVEILREQTDYKLRDSDIPMIAHAMRVVESVAREYIQSMISVGLIHQEGDFIFSESLIRRMREYDNRKKMLAEMGRLGGISSGIGRKSKPPLKPPFKKIEATLKPGFAVA